MLHYLTHLHDANVAFGMGRSLPSVTRIFHIHFGLMLALALDGHLKGGQTTQTARRDAYTLTALARRFGVSVYGEHDALADALITAQVFLVIATELERSGQASTVRELSRLSGYGGGFLGLFR